MNFVPIKFVGERIEVFFEKPPLLEKKPGCPQGFTWRGENYVIVELVEEWHDYRRRGTMGRNMRLSHLTAASRRGSWGVGQDYYRVRTQDGRYFDLYYDRAPKSVDERKGGWWLDRELSALQDDADAAV